MITRYDEFPVHQAVRPFSEVPSTDYAWSDGYYFAVYSPAADAELFVGLRVHPNSDVVSGFVGIATAGRQRTVRLSRQWRPDCDTVVGPLRVDFVEPLQRIRLALDDNESGFSFELTWIAVAPPVEEPRRLYTANGRRTTDQLRYLQSGTAGGWIRLDDRRFEVSEDGGWAALRDHSWGLYFETPPLKPPADALPPPERTRSFEPLPHEQPVPLAFYTWNFFLTERHTGVFWAYEDEQGGRPRLFSASQAMQPGGVVDDRVTGRRLHVVDVQHELRFDQGRRFLGGELSFVDELGGTWRQEVEAESPPWLFWPGGVWPGAWRDGGGYATYHGPGVALEWDETDIARQPCSYQSAPHMPKITNLLGAEYMTTVRLVGPDGDVHGGVGHSEIMIHGSYKPYGFDGPGPSIVGEGPF